MLDFSEQYPNIIKVRVGQVDYRTNPEAVPDAEDWRPGAFNIPVKDIVLGYYFQNKYGFSFGRPKVMSE